MENVTLASAFLIDIHSHFKADTSMHKRLKHLSKDYDLTNPLKHVPFTFFELTYNWISKTCTNGISSVAERIAETVYNKMSSMNLVSERNCSPIQIINALIEVAPEFINDPSSKRWEVLENGSDYIVLKRYSTFCSKLQLNLLKVLMTRSNQDFVTVSREKASKTGKSYDQYRISW